MERYFSSILGESKLAALIELGRPWNGLLVISLTFVGALLTSITLPSIALLFAGGLITLLVYMAATTLNDVYDIRIDLINMPYRPLQKNLISTKTAKIFAYVLYLIALIGSFYISFQYFIIIFIMAIISVMYSVPPTSFKNRSILGNLFLSVDTIFITLISGAVLVNASFSFPINFLYITFFLTLSFILISVSKDFKDIKGDRAFGKFTAVIHYGKNSMISLIVIGKLVLLYTLTFMFFQFIPNIIYLIISSGLTILLIFIPLKIYKKHFTSDAVEKAWSFERIFILLIIINLLIFLYLNHL
jgi:4-hydroxybenzoate polyprenyltransferase